MSHFLGYVIEQLTHEDERTRRFRRQRRQRTETRTATAPLVRPAKEA